MVIVLGVAAGTGSPDFASIDRQVAAEMVAARIPGLALEIVQRDRIVHLRGFGVTAVDGPPVTPGTLFGLASLSKSLAAVAAMQLVEAGRLDLDAPVRRYLPWFRTKDAEASGENHVATSPQSHEWSAHRRWFARRW